MQRFAYVAKLEDGRRVSGTLEAASQSAVLEALHNKGLVVVRIVKAKAESLRQRRVGLDDLAIFSRQMATLVDAGIPLVGGLEAVADQLENRTLRRVVTQVKRSIEEGMNFTAAIAKQTHVFSPLFVSMVRAGEASGHLAEVLDRLAIYLEKSASLQRKVKTAMVYPAVVSTVAFLITSALIIKVVPTFKEMFNTLGVALPMPTQILLGISDWFAALFLPGIGCAMLGSYLFKNVFLKSRAGRLLFDSFLLNLKIVGPIVRKVSIAKFARTLATLVKSGVPILSALEIVSETAGNQVVAEAILKVKASIKGGENIAGPLAASGVFPPVVVRMIAVGEQTGRLDDMLVKVALFYEDQVDAAISGLTSAIEPLIIVVLGVVVGSIVISIFLPIFKLTETLSH